MKFAIGMPPNTQCTLRDAQRVAYDTVRLQFIATVLGYLVLVPVCYLLWRQFFDNDAIFGLIKGGPTLTQALQFVGLLIATLVIHELCHLIAHPRFGLGDQSYVGIDKKSGMPYVVYCGVISRTRFILIGLAPIALLSVGSLGLALLYPALPPYLALISLFNMAGAGADVIMVSVIMWRAPRNAYIQRDYYGLRP